jgi:uncharacterized membrane protein
MKFFKSTLFTGFVVLFPILLLSLALTEIIGVLIALAEPIAALFPKESIERVNLPGLLAIILMALMSFMIGLLLRSDWLIRVGNAFERKVLLKLPMYKMLKLISASLTETDTSAFRPALIRSANGGGDPCYIIERHDNGLATVLLPWSPASFAGSVKVVSADSLHELDCTLDAFSLSLTLMGVGVESCLKAPAPTVR